MSEELAYHLLNVASDIGRRVGALVNRRGHVETVVIGDAHRIYLPDLGRTRAGGGKLRGLRWVQTNERDHDFQRDDIADLSKLRLDYSLLLTRTPGGKLKCRGAHLVPTETGTTHRVQETHELQELVGNFADFIAQIEHELGKNRTTAARSGQLKPNRALLISVGSDRDAVTARQTEMKELCRTAGVSVVHSVMQLRSKLDPTHMVGRGKLEELVLEALQLDAEILVFDQELAPAQYRTIADATELKVLDRTQVILDIFAQHATSDDGKLQVELAQLRYNLPRISEMSTAMSRLTGGIGGRGPGETKLELNRRKAKDRIGFLEEKIDELSERREVRRQKRRSSGLPVVAIVGYTNAGKSTLLNTLTGSDVLAQDKLFATLEPATRRLRLPSGQFVTLSDTVGFIRDLPPDLINAFRATLEELRDADLLLQVVDASDAQQDAQYAAVTRILKEMELSLKKRVVVFNKADVAEREHLRRLIADGEVVVSATEKKGALRLLERIDALLGFQQPQAEEYRTDFGAKSDG